MTTSPAKGKQFKGTWLDARAIQTTITGGELPRGHRLILTHWLDDAKGQPIEYAAGTKVATTTSGDFRKNTGKVHAAPRVIEDATYDRLRAEVGLR